MPGLRTAPLPRAQAGLQCAHRVLATQMLRKQTHIQQAEILPFRKKKKHDDNLVYKQELPVGWGGRLDGFFKDSDSAVDLCFGGTEKNLECYFCLLEKFSESISANYCH